MIKLYNTNVLLSGKRRHEFTVERLYYLKQRKDLFISFLNLYQNTRPYAIIITNGSLPVGPNSVVTSDILQKEMFFPPRF